MIKTCRACHTEFEAEHRQQLLCSKCRAINQKSVFRKKNKSLMQEYKEMKAAAKRKHVKRVPDVSIEEIVRRTEEYNRKNGTLLSYGQYVAKMGE